MGEVLKQLDIGLSLLLRYSYGGFLLVVLAKLIDPCVTGKVLDTLPWEIIALSALAMGGGIYAIHRGAIIPVHHLLLCLFLWIRDQVWEVEKAVSNSPTRWLGSMGVQWGSRISAYTALRRSKFFSDDEKRSLNLGHAEGGLIVMTFEGLALSACYTRAHPHTWQLAPNTDTLVILAVVFFIFSFFPGWAQHQVECRRFRKRNKYVYLTLRELGFLT